jgi:isoprenylcysteine carboxyl methyltransferase (ICMT) family protein YpbQ
MIKVTKVMMLLRHVTVACLRQNEQNVLHEGFNWYSPSNEKVFFANFLMFTVSAVRGHEVDRQGGVDCMHVAQDRNM